MRSLQVETALATDGDSLLKHRDMTRLKTDRNTLLTRPRSRGAYILILTRAATDVNATAIGVRRAICRSASDFPPGIARVGRPETVVPVQIL